MNGMVGGIGGAGMIGGMAGIGGVAGGAAIGGVSGTSAATPSAGVAAPPSPSGITVNISDASKAALAADITNAKPASVVLLTGADAVNGTSITANFPDKISIATLQNLLGWNKFDDSIAALLLALLLLHESEKK
jgi:hypothetical protein